MKRPKTAARGELMRTAIAVPILAACFGLGLSGRPASSPRSVTTFADVYPIFQRNCQTCHRPGDIAPFSLMTYSEARPYASSIMQKTQAREMPPWKPVEGCGEFLGERSITAEEIAMIASWVEGGAIEGVPVAPSPIEDNPWPLGQPDVTLHPDEDYTVTPGDDVYRCFSIPTSLRGDRFLSGVDIRPGNRNVVHHVIIFTDPTGASKRLDDADPGPGYTSFGGPGFEPAGTLGGWVPGATARFEPEGAGWMLSNDSRVVIQVHYHPRGMTETDRTQIGLYYSKEPVRKQLQLLPLINQDFVIPPNDPHFRVTAGAIVPPGFSAHAVAIAPHMHLLGREMKVQARYPDGTTNCLINIEDWDFHWQGAYHFKQQVPLPAFTRLDLTAYYDNSSGNPDNPNNPPKAVRWGEQTTDEMCIAFIEFTLDSESRVPSSPQISSVSVTSDGRLEVDGSGFLPGADIYVDGQRVTDTINHKKKKKSAKILYSSEDFKRLMVPGRQVSIRVINTDGANSPSVTFTM